MLDLKKCTVRWDTENYIPKKVSDFETPPLKGSPKTIAKKFLKENLGVLKISASINDLTFEKTVESIGASTVLFQQHFQGRPIHGAWVAVHINRGKRVFMVKNDTVPAQKLKRQLPKAKAVFLSSSKINATIRKKAKEFGDLTTAIKKESMLYVLKGQIKHVWKVKFGTKKPAGSWILFVDKTNGQIIEERNILKKIIGKGRVFRPNPIVTLDRDDLFDKKDADQEIFDKAYKRVKLKGLHTDGYLKGSYVDTTNTPNNVRSLNYEFVFTREDDRFEEVMAYYHIDTIQRYMQSLGFRGNRGILDKPIKANVHGGFDDQSYYDPSPGKKDLTYGDGGVDDAEDADIIAHEYGHALQDAIVPGFGQTDEGRAIGEGFGDYLAGSFYYEYKKKSRRVKIAEWDAKGFAGGPQEYLRRLDSTKHYPEDMEGEEHLDGEIWSACLWEVRRLLGKKRADTVILESHFYLNQYSDFRDGAEALILANKNVFNGWRSKALKKIFERRGIL
ncbi:MAG: M36 family metallopeptidase [Nitrospiraceae bacterium]|nr:MAG: M36 family metallopeptidase [Nitrospiraceae bacterium]